MHLDSSACSDLQSASHVRAISPHPVLRSTEPSPYVCDEYVRLKYIDTPPFLEVDCDPTPTIFTDIAGVMPYTSRRRPTCSRVSDQETSGARLEAVEYEGGSGSLRLLGSCRISILFRKSLRQDRSHKLWSEANKKPSSGNLHAGFDEAGTGNQLTVWLVRYSQRKRRETDRPNLRSMAPVLDPTSSLAQRARATEITANTPARRSSR
jgi:hypothetical protein